MEEKVAKLIEKMIYEANWRDLEEGFFDFTPIAKAVIEAVLCDDLE